MNGQRPCTILMVTGEESGDLHGAHLLHHLAKCIPSLRVFGIGGDRMRDEGMEIIYHYRDFAVVGFTEVVKMFPRLWAAMRRMEELIRKRRVDLVLLIDYPGFNLRLAKKAHRLGVKVFYYIAPQVWAWGEKRIRQMAEVIDELAVVLPFEPDIYCGTSLRVNFVGHPLLDIVKPRYSTEEFFTKYNLSPERPIIGFLPGSRWHEVKRLFPVMLDTLTVIKKQIPNIQAVVGMPQTLERKRYIPFLPPSDPPLLVENGSYDIMANAKIVLTASGTAALETAILQCPMIIMYKMSFLTYHIIKRIIKIKRVGLVNIVAGKDVAPEYIQVGLDPERIAEDAIEILTDPEKRKSIRDDLLTVRQSLGQPGAAERTAQSIVRLIEQNE